MSREDNQGEDSGISQYLDISRGAEVALEAEIYQPKDKVKEENLQVLGALVILQPQKKTVLISGDD